MSNQIILVADSDPKNLQILKENLEASGFQVITVVDGTKAWEEIHRITPKLILTEINLTGLSGFQLLEKLQADPNTSFIPLIFLTNQREVQQRVRSFKMGAKDYLVKPLHVKEVIAHIRMVIHRLEKRQVDQSDHYSKFSGRLSELNLADLIESFSVERKTGVLTLNNGNNKSGQVFFREGTVINANLGDIQLENAIYKMLQWNKGFFSMVFKDVDIPDEISISNLGLLLEGVKRQEHRDKLIRKFPSPKTAFTITSSFQKMLEKKKLPGDVKLFISLIDGKKTIKNIIDDSCYDDIKTLERLLRLYQQGLIKPTIAPTISKQQEIVEKVEQERNVKEELLKIELPPEKDEKPPKIETPPEKVEKPPEIESPSEKTEKPMEQPQVPDLTRPIKERIKKRRSEIIIPEESDIAGEKENPPVEEEPIEETKTIEADEPPATLIEPADEKLIAPSFNRDEFLNRQKRQPDKKEWEEKTKTNIPENEEDIPKFQKLLQHIDKTQLLVIGFDDDSLDEVMDILTDNTFQTKKLEKLSELPIHYGKITDEEFEFLTLLGIFVDRSLNKVVGALSYKLLGNIFVIDCTKGSDWEYISYLIHSTWNSYKIPFVVAITNLHEQNSTTLDMIRSKLNLNNDIGIVAWDAVDKSSIKRLLSPIVYRQEKDRKKTANMLEELVEKVTI